MEWRVTESETTTRAKKVLPFLAMFCVIALVPAPLIPLNCYLLIFSGVALLVWLTGNRPVCSLTRDWPWVVFILSLIPSVCAAEYPGDSRGVAVYIFTIFPLTVLISRHCFADLSSRRGILLSVLFLASLVAVIGLLELWFGKNILYEGYIENPFYERFSQLQHRPISTQYNAAFLGTFLLGCLPIAYAARDCVGGRLKAVVAAGVVLIAFVMFLTFSRGVLLSFAAGGLFSLWFGYGRRGLALGFLMVFGVILIASYSSYSVAPLLGRLGFERLVYGSSDSIFSPFRKARVEMAWAITRERPWFGIGLRGFYADFNNRRDPAMAGTPEEFKIIDNMYLTLLAEAGVTGLIGFLVMMTVVMRKLWSRCRNERGRNQRSLSAAIFVGLLACLVNMGAYDVLYCPNPFLMFGVLLGFALALEVEEAVGRPEEI